MGDPSPASSGARGDGPEASPASRLSPSPLLPVDMVLPVMGASSATYRASGDCPEASPKLVFSPKSPMLSANVSISPFVKLFTLNPGGRWSVLAVGFSEAFSGWDEMVGLNGEERGCVDGKFQGGQFEMGGLNSSFVGGIGLASDEVGYSLALGSIDEVEAVWGGSV